MKSPKARVDRLLTDRGLAESREKPQALILAGEVLVNGKKPASQAAQSPPMPAANSPAASPSSPAAA